MLHNLLLAGAVYAQPDIPIMRVLQDSISPTAVRGLGAYASKAGGKDKHLYYGARYVLLSWS